ncbi:MAG: U32 family peptidase [Clostridia bacterium]|nr:U32 family peptidase [Clostridia bacterium]
MIGANGLNCANSESVKALKNIGVSTVIISPEISIASAKALPGDIKKGIFAYGRLPLMLTRNCPVKNVKTCAGCGKKSFLTDRKGIAFPVACRQGYSEIFNSIPIYLADKRDDLSGFDFILLSFTDESKAEVERIINDYKNGAFPPESFTRGLYYKNIQ